MQHVVDRAGSPRRAALRLLHGVSRTVVDVWLAPLVLDDRVVVALPDRVGVVFDGDGLATASWVGPHAIVNEAEGAEAVEQVGAAIGAAHRLLVDRYAWIGRLRRCTVETMVLDSVEGATARLLRHRPGHPMPVPALLHATGLASRRPQRTVRAWPDDGPPVDLTVRRVCCMLSRHREDTACPTCPLTRDDEVMRRYVEGWLSDVDDDDFVYVTGRARQRGRDGAA